MIAVMVPTANVSRVWGAVLLTASAHGFQTLLQAVVVHDRGRWVHPWSLEAPLVPHPVTEKE